MTDRETSAFGAGSPLAGERHVSDVASRGSGVSKRAGMGLLLGATGLLCGFILVRGEHKRPAHDESATLAVQPIVKYEPPPPLPEHLDPTPAALPVAPPLPTSLHPASIAPVASHPQQQRILVYTAAGAGGAQRGAPAEAGPVPVQAAAAEGEADPFAGTSGSSAAANPIPARGGALGNHMQTTAFAGVQASVLAHQPYLLTTGHIIPCILQTAMDSTLPGLVTCVIPQDVLGKTGLTLLDRGTLVTGQFQAGVKQGVARMFVVWTRAETPQGVVIALDSPASDPLGRAGLDGDVDTHFWQRFGGALLLSTVDGALQAGVAAASKNGSTYISTGNTQSVVGEALQGSVNLPPTIRKNQGELVSIFVARDLDFASVYRILPTQAAAPQVGGSAAR